MRNQSLFSTGMFRGTLLMLMIFIGCANAKAVKWTPIELEQEIKVQAFVDAFYSITPTEDGVMRLVTVSGAGTNGYAVTSTGKTTTDGSVETAWSWASDNSPSFLSFAVKAGTTYYISLNFPMDSWTFKATMNSGDFSFTGSSPADGAMFYITSHETVFLYFTSNSVSFTEGEVTVGNNIVKVYNYNDYDRLVENGTFTYTQEGMSGVVNWNGAICGREENGIAISFTSATGHGYFNVLNRLYDEGKLKENDPIKLTIHGIKDRLTGKTLANDGTIEVTWYFGGAPTTLTEAKMPLVIKSWFNEGDPDAIATFSFSKPIKRARASLEMGQGEGADDLYIEEIETKKIIFDGKDVKVDLSGVMRTNKTMGLKYDWPSFTLQLYAVVDIDGNDTFSEDLGSASSYSYVIAYKNISTELGAEFNPKSGTTLSESTDEIEIWFNNSDVIEWDGVSFTYYILEEVEDVDNEGNPVVTEQNVAYDTFIPKSALKYTVEDNETTIIVPVPAELRKAHNIRLGVNVTSSVDGMDHVIAAYYNTSLSHDLDLALYADPADESTVSYLKEIYLTLGSTYAINTKIAPQVKGYGKTTGKVLTGTIVEDGMTNAKIELSEILTEADTYEFVIEAGVIGDYIYGESHYQTGITNERCTLTYTVDGKYAGKPVIIDPAEGEVNSLKSFTMQFIEYASVAPSWNVEAYVEDAEGKRLYGQFSDAHEGEPNAVTFVLNEAITANGTYTLVIPAEAVCNGATGDPLEETYNFQYTVVDNNTTVGRFVFGPGEKVNVYSLTGTVVLKDVDAEVLENLAPGIYIVDGKKIILK